MVITSIISRNRSEITNYRQNMLTSICVSESYLLSIECAKLSSSLQVQVNENLMVCCDYFGIQDIPINIWHVQRGWIFFNFNFNFNFSWGVLVVWDDQGRTFWEQYTTCYTYTLLESISILSDYSSTMCVGVIELV